MVSGGSMATGTSSLVLLSGIGLLAVAGAAAVSAGIIVLIRPMLIRHALARPNGRSSHRVPTPQGGGVGVVVATFVVVAILGLTLSYLGTHSAGTLTLVVAAAALTALVGAIDDMRSMPVVPRLLLQTLAVALVLVALPTELRVIPQLPWWLERAGLLVAGLWFVNLVNFMDGIDWMTVAEVVPITVGLVLLGTLGALPLHGLIVALALLGATLGFAPFNRPVAKLFLGDVGSLPIGLLIGWLLVLLAGSGHLVAALILPLYYLADATITLLRRLGNGEPVWQAHRTHFYQRATDHGLTVPQIVTRVFGANMLLVTLAAVTVLLPTSMIKISAAVLACAVVGWLLLGFSRGKTDGSSARISRPTQVAHGPQI